MMPDLTTQMVEALREHMAANRMTHAEFAQSIGLNPASFNTQLAKWSHGSVMGADTLEKLATAIGARWIMLGPNERARITRVRDV